MTIVENYRGISVGDNIICTKSNFACYGNKGIVKEIRENEGSKTGWYKGEFLDGGGFLLAGDEIRKLDE